MSLRDSDIVNASLESSGDVVQFSRNQETLSLNIQYSTIDYGKNEFSQVQVRDGTIEFVKTDNGYTVRNSENEYLSGVRDTLFGKIEKVNEAPLEKIEVSLSNITSYNLRSKFFHELMLHLPGYTLRDVTSVYVYKAKPEDDDETGDADSHVEKVFLRGNGVTRSEILNDLLEHEHYYMVKVGWKTKENLGAGHMYDIEATFSDPKDCIGFSFILNG